MGFNLKMQKGLAANEQAMEQAFEKEKRERETKERREKVIEMFNSGMSQVAIAEKFNVDKSTITRDLQYIRKNYPEKLLDKAAEPQEQTEDTITAADIPTEHEPIAQDTPQATEKPHTAPEPSQPMQSTPTEEKAEYKPNKTATKTEKKIMGFRAAVDRMEVWKLYADATGQEISSLCTAALDEYVDRHKLTEEQKQLFDLKRKMLEDEKKIKGNVK